MSDGLYSLLSPQQNLCVREVSSIVVGIAVGLAWFGLWIYLLQAFGIPLVQWSAVDCSGRRERLKRLGRFRYVLLCGILGPGVAFGLAMVVPDYVWRDSFRWKYELPKLLFMSVLFGLFQGVRKWREFGEPVPFLLQL
jgi:hypothetical protein